MSKLDEILSEIERLDKEATPPPWWNESGTLHAKASTWTKEVHACCHPASCEEEADAEFVELARTALPLLAKILRAIIDEHFCLSSSRIRDRLEFDPRAIAERVIEEAKPQ